MRGHEFEAVILLPLPEGEGRAEGKITPDFLASTPSSGTTCHLLPKGEENGTIILFILMIQHSLRQPRLAFFQ